MINTVWAIVRDGKIDSKSPVILTWPSEGQQAIVGESLYDFLCFGLHGGYFQILSNSEAGPTSDGTGLWFFPHVADAQREVLTFLAEELGLVPWPWKDRKKRYKALQDRFLSSFQVAGMDDSE